MHSGNNRTNHDFQIRYFLIGACHTPDAAYALLCDLKESRSDALKVQEASKLKNEAKRKRLLLKIKKAKAISDSASDTYESEEAALDVEDAKAELAEMDAMVETGDKCVAAAEAELATIERYMELLEPHRQFAHLPLDQAHEACQREEWRLELLKRAQNFLLTSNSIPSDHFNTMRQHPDFESYLLPAIDTFNAIRHSTKMIEVTDAAGGVTTQQVPVNVQDILHLTAQHIGEFDLPKLLKTEVDVQHPLLGCDSPVELKVLTGE